MVPTHSQRPRLCQGSRKFRLKLWIRLGLQNTAAARPPLQIRGTHQHDREDLVVQSRRVRKRQQMLVNRPESGQAVARFEWGCK
jgi:hypothetical protein